mgnify:CR=1 FL=1
MEKVHFLGQAKPVENWKFMINHPFMKHTVSSLNSVACIHCPVQLSIHQIGQIQCSIVGFHNNFLTLSMKKLKQLFAFLCVRIIIIIIYLSLITKIYAQGFVWWLLLAIFIASIVIEKKYFVGILLVVFAFFIEFFSSKLLFNGKDVITAQLFYASTVLLSFLIVYYPSVVRKTKING